MRFRFVFPQPILFRDLYFKPIGFDRFRVLRAAASRLLFIFFLKTHIESAKKDSFSKKDTQRKGNKK